MKTQITKTISLLFIIIAISGFTYAGVDSDKEPTTKKCSASKEVKELNNISTLNNTVLFASWNYIEFEQELEVVDLNKIDLSNRIPWIFPEMEHELKVTDFRKTEDLIPYWMIIENETELEVTDLAIK